MTRRNLRRLCGVCAVILLLSVLTGCGEKNEELDKLQQSKTLRTAIFARDGRPVVDVNTDSGEYALAYSIAEKLGLQLELTTPETADTPETVLDQGLADMVLGYIPDMDSFHEAYSVSIYYDRAFLYVATRQGDYRNILPVFQGAKVGRTAELSAAMRLDTASVTDQANVYSSAADAAQALVSGELDGYFCYLDEASELANTEGIQVQDVVGTDPEELVILIPQAYQSLQETVDQAILQYLDSGA